MARSFYRMGAIQKIFFFIIMDILIGFQRGINLFLIFIEGKKRCFLSYAPKTF